jgi:hypothetical protein
MHNFLRRFLPVVGLLACPIGAQGQTHLTKAIVDSAFGTRVRIEAARPSGKAPAAVIVTVFRPARPVTIRLAISQVRLLMSLSDSVLALPTGPDKATWFPIYVSPANVGSTRATGCRST